MNESDSSKKGRRVDLFFFDKREAPFDRSMTDRALFFVPNKNKRDLHSLEMSLKSGEDNFLDHPNNVEFNRKNNIHELYDKFRASNASKESKRNIWDLKYNSVSKKESELIEYIHGIPFSDKSYVTSYMAYLLSKEEFTDIQDILEAPSGDITDISGIGKAKLEKLYYGIFFDNIVRLARNYNETKLKSLNRKRYYKLYCLFSKYNFSDSTKEASKYALDSVFQYRSITLSKTVFDVGGDNKLEFSFSARIKSTQKILFLKYLAKLSSKSSEKRSMFALNNINFVKNALTEDEFGSIEGDLFVDVVQSLVDKIDHELEIRDSYWKILERYLKN